MASRMQSLRVMYFEATRDTISLSVTTGLQEGGDTFKVNTPYMHRKQPSNTTVSRKKCQFKFSIVRYLREFFLFLLMGLLATLQARFILSPSGLRLQSSIDTQDHHSTVPPKVPRAYVDLLFVILYDISLSVALVPCLSQLFRSFGFPLSKTALPRSCRQENRDPDHAWLFIDWTKRPRSIMITE